MVGSAEAITGITEYVASRGEKMRLGQIVPRGGDEVAGMGVDKLTEVRVGGLDKRVFSSGVLSGRLACRAVLLEPGVTGQFVGAEGVEGVLHIRTRLEYDEPRNADLAAALTTGGRVTHLAVQNLVPGDGRDLDDYYAQLAEYEAALRAGDGTLSVDIPNMPQAPELHTHYELQLPDTPNVKGTNDTQRAQRRLELRLLGFNAMQDEYPETRVLSASTQGYVSQHELGDWASAFVG